MKTKIARITLTTLLSLIVLSACGPIDSAPDKYTGSGAASASASAQTEKATNQPSPTENETAASSSSDATNEEKYAIIEVKNLSGSSFIMDCDVHPYEVTDAYMISAFTVKDSESMKMTLSAETYVQNGKMIETSPTTYAIIIDFVLANMPTDKDELAMDQTEGPFELDEMNVTGTYNQPVIIVWDGAKYIKK